MPTADLMMSGRLRNPLEPNHNRATCSHLNEWTFLKIQYRRARLIEFECGVQKVGRFWQFQDHITVAIQIPDMTINGLK